MFACFVHTQMCMNVYVHERVHVRVCACVSTLQTEGEPSYDRQKNINTKQIVIVSMTMFQYVPQIYITRRKSTKILDGTLSFLPNTVSTSTQNCTHSGLYTQYYCVHLMCVSVKAFCDLPSHVTHCHVVVCR